MQSAIHLQREWIPRSVKQQADFISRLIDIDDWQITNAVFLFLEDRWRPHSEDCFSTYQKHQLPISFSRFWSPYSADVDFLFQPLRGENCLLVPPVSINIRELKHATFLSHRRTPEVYSFPILLVFTLPHLYF